MYPYSIFLGITLYEIFLVAGILAAMIILRVLSDRTGIETRLFNFSLGTGVAAIAGGYCSAVLFQAFYNFLDTGVFEIKSNTGMTFYGGLIGGAAAFLLIYFVLGRFIFRDSLHIKRFYRMAGIAACSITAAHSLGRIGCLMAGCCYGIESETFGIHMVHAGEKMLPVQLYEAIFLAALCAFFFIRALKQKSYNLPMYMIFYGIWRFLIEYLRADNRGATIVSFLSPSQLTAVILIAAGATLWFFERRDVELKKRGDAQRQDKADAGL